MQRQTGANVDCAGGARVYISSTPVELAGGYVVQHDSDLVLLCRRLLTAHEQQSLCCFRSSLHLLSALSFAVCVCVCAFFCSCAMIEVSASRERASDPSLLATGRTDAAALVENLTVLL